MFLCVVWMPYSMRPHRLSSDLMNFLLLETVFKPLKQTDHLKDSNIFLFLKTVQIKTTGHMIAVLHSDTAISYLICGYYRCTGVPGAWGSGVSISLSFHGSLHLLHHPLRNRERLQLVHPDVRTVPECTTQTHADTHTGQICYWMIVSVWNQRGASDQYVSADISQSGVSAK